MNINKLIAEVRASEEGRVHQPMNSMNRKDLSDALGLSRIPVRDVGELRADGRRKLDQAVGTSNLGNAATIRKSVLQTIATRKAKISQAMSVIDTSPDANSIEFARKQIKLENARHSFDLKSAKSCLSPKIAIADCTLPEDLESWLLTYKQMLDGDENYETSYYYNTEA